jgi:processive 1,2-diacylglycerol beta-glucosyltransferase
MRALLLFAPFGNGHRRAAEAAAAALQDRGVAVTVADVFSLASPSLAKVAADAWSSLLKVAPSAYAAVYRWTEGASTPADHLAGNPWVISSLLGPALKRQLDRLQPDLVATTHPVPLTLAAALKRESRRYHLLSIHTDYTIHGFSVLPGVDGYCIPHAALLPEMERRHVGPERVFLTGIPVDPTFHKRLPKAEARLRLGLTTDGFIVAIMGGGLGMGPMVESVQAMTGLERPPITLAFTGRNRSLAASLLDQTFPGLQVIPFTDRVDLYMDAIDLLVTKPGGLTLAEAIAKQLPLALLRPLPGQEERNLSFLVANRAAVAVQPGELGDLVAGLMTSPTLLDGLRQRAAALALPDGAARVADAAVRMMGVQDVSA